MESLLPELALYGGNNECATTNTVFLSISKVSTGAVSLKQKWISQGGGGGQTKWIRFFV